MKPDQERVKNLLTDTVTLLCKNGLTFAKELRVEGLLGITTDSNDVFFIHISDTFGENGERIIEPDPKETNSIADRSVDKRGLKDRGGDSPQQPKNVNKSQGSHHRPNTPSSPNMPERHSRSSTPPTPVRIKQEKHDDVILIEAKTEGLSSCSRQSYSDTTHGNHTDNYSGLESMDSDHGTYQQYQDELDGEPPTKRRTMGSEEDSGSGGGDSLGAYITGIVRNVHEKPETSQGSAWTPPAVNLGAEIAAQMAQAAMAQGDNSLAGLDGSMAGPSSWSPGQNLGTPSSQPSDMYSMLDSRYLRAGKVAPFACEYPGCNRRYQLKRDLRKHERKQHGRQPQFMTRQTSQESCDSGSDYTVLDLSVGQPSTLKRKHRHEKNGAVS